MPDTRVVVVGHGMGGLLVLKAAERRPISGLVLIASELPGDVREPTAPHLIRLKADENMPAVSRVMPVRCTVGASR